jgi:hypothetical protein
VKVKSEVVHHLRWDMRHHVAYYTDKYNTTQLDSAVRCTSQQIRKLTCTPVRILKYAKRFRHFLILHLLCERKCERCYQCRVLSGCRDILWDLTKRAGHLRLSSRSASDYLAWIQRLMFEREPDAYQASDKVLQGTGSRRGYSRHRDTLIGLMLNP